MSSIQSLSRVLVLLATMGLATFAHAVVIGPYTVDANTKHLWHFDENGASGTTAADAGPSPNYTLDVKNNATTQGTSYAGVSGFGTSLDNSTATTTSGAESADNVVDATSFWNTDSLDSIADGAFTWEAIVKFNDLTTATQSILALENEGSTGRYGRLVFKGSATPGSRVLNFEKVPVTAQTVVSAALPSIGDDALNTTDWFHIAVAYDGNGNTADNLKFYFTKLTNDALDQTAHLLSSHNLNGDLSAGSGLADFAVSNNARSLGSKFFGFVDEVRISDTVRAANEFMFTIPEPSTTMLIVIGSSCFVFTRRKTAALRAIADQGSL
jgi:hypothetical protein